MRLRDFLAILATCSVECFFFFAVGIKTNAAFAIAMILFICGLSELNYLNGHLPLPIPIKIKKG